MPDLTAEEPSFPPLLTSCPTEFPTDTAEQALAEIARQKAGAGDLFWSSDKDRLTFSLVLEPDVPKERCYEILYVAMVAFGDAAGALMPPEVSVTFAWPSFLLVNDGKVGYVDLLIAPTASEEDIPDWLLLTMDVEMRPAEIAYDPGLTYNRTTFWEEGCGHISRTDLLNSVARHFLTWLHTWNEEGFHSIYDQWMERLLNKKDISILYDGSERKGDFVGMDETGNIFFRSDGSTSVLQTRVALEDNRVTKADRI